MNLAVMTQEVKTWCKEKGWYDEPVPFLEAVALLHSEVAELDDAWESHGLEPFDAPSGGPDGAAIELADILIRALDDCGRFGFTARQVPVRIANARVPSAIRLLHRRCRDITEAYRKHGTGPETEAAVNQLIGTVQAFAITFGLDLLAAYNEKMTYNWQREYRHGGQLALCGP